MLHKEDVVRASVTECTALACELKIDDAQHSKLIDHDIALCKVMMMPSRSMHGANDIFAQMGPDLRSSVTLNGRK
jgi:hypothetical protein